MRIPSPLSIVINVLLFAGLAAIWIAFAPMMVGGKASYVVVNGISMEPGFHRGDLVIVRAAATYQPGDIVTYRNAELNAFVIHRIIGIEEDHYVFKGDNNSWIDTYRPTRAELIGKLWVHVPKLGRGIEWLRYPIHMGLTTGLLGGILMASIMIKPKQQRKAQNTTSGNLGGLLEGGLYFFGLVAVFFLSLSIFAFIRPLTRPADKIQYQQESHFSYTATGTPVIYDTETVRSGEPIFPRLTCFLNIAYTYNVQGNQLEGISGNYQLIARVMDEQSGWQRTIPMNEKTAFNGNSFATASNLDLCQIVTLVNTLKQQTGLRTSNFTLEIIPQVSMNANALGNPVVDSLEPRLVFQFDEVHFSLATPKGQDDPLYLSKQGSAENRNLEPNTLSLLAWKPTIGTVRKIALVGLALSLSGLLIIVSCIYRTMQQSQEALIRLKYGRLLVNVYERDLEPAAMLIDVTMIDELAKLAERHNTVILHMTSNFLHCYLVQCNGLTYRYVFSAGGRGVAEIEPLSQEIISYTLDNNGNSIVQMEPTEEDLFGYAINKRSISKTEVTDTVILRKIRL
jgi:signal peptidase I